MIRRTKRRALFTTTLLMATMIASIPFVGRGGDIAWATYRGGYFPFHFLGLDNNWTYSCHSYYETMVGNVFYDHYWMSPIDSDRVKMYVYSIDPETGGSETDVVSDSHSKSFETRQFDFQHRTVTLATLWQRGCARVIDLMLFIAILAGVFYGLTRAWDIDWFSAAEARVVGVKQHPSFASAYRTLLACQIMSGVMLLLLIVFQGRNGLTPGKWVCGLRTMRTTLRPCGFARSLVREFLLCVDSVNLFSWIPGILSIAFTEHRQRLGDVVADTIVVSDKRSASGPLRVIPSFSPHS